MEIKIIDAQALRLAQAALSPKDKVSAFRHVRITPEGAITGTNGHTLAHHPSAAEPFDGKPLYITPQRTIPTDARDITLDIERGQLRFRQKGRDNVMLLAVNRSMDDYPDIGPLLDHWPVSVDARDMIVNAAQLASYAKASGDTSIGWQFVSNKKNGVMLSLYGRKGQVTLMIPLGGSVLGVTSRLAEVA